MSKDKKKKAKADKKEKIAVEPATGTVTKVSPPKAKKPAAAPRKKGAVAPVISPDDIALRAYYIAEARNARGIAGSESGDWHEAERQLREEAKKKK